ncbi:T-box transcription factor tbx3 [Cichlidogyrus casuarinus]|uniref:T-box transcription factor tbx3 n=1 Tax=Cichlidogyrus casuarinus TaxID=1844966 RepID=A0ABD2QJC3_9PLAT
MFPSAAGTIAISSPNQSVESYNSTSSMPSAAEEALEQSPSGAAFFAQFLQTSDAQKVRLLAEVYSSFLNNKRPASEASQKSELQVVDCIMPSRIALKTKPETHEYMQSPHYNRAVAYPFTIPSSGQDVESGTDMLEPYVELVGKDMWRSFHKNTTEMIITKTGRRLFPPFKVFLKGLDPHAIYAVMFDVSLAENSRYKFHNGKWDVAGKADPEPQHSYYLHPDSPAPGIQWLNKVIAFDKCKLTNNISIRQSDVSPSP